MNSHWRFEGRMLLRTLWRIFGRRCAADAPPRPAGGGRSAPEARERLIGRGVRVEIGFAAGLPLARQLGRIGAINSPTTRINSNLKQELCWINCGMHSSTDRSGPNRKFPDWWSIWIRWRLTCLSMDICMRDSACRPTPSPRHLGEMNAIHCRNEIPPGSNLKQKTSAAAASFHRYWFISSPRRGWCHDETAPSV